jgi:hypothetical protein
LCFRGFIVYQKEDFNFASYKTYPKILNLTVEKMSDGKVTFSLPGEGIFVLEPPLDDREQIQIG